MRTYVKPDLACKFGYDADLRQRAVAYLNDD